MSKKMRTAMFRISSTVTLLLAIIYVWNGIKTGFPNISGEVWLYGLQKHYSLTYLVPGWSSILIGVILTPILITCGWFVNNYMDDDSADISLKEGTLILMFVAMFIGYCTSFFLGLYSGITYMLTFPILVVVTITVIRFLIWGGIRIFNWEFAVNVKN